MKGIRLLPTLLLLTLWSFTASAQSVSSITVGPNQYNCNTVLTATIQGLLPNLCTSVNSSVLFQGSNVNIYLGFWADPGICTQVLAPFTQTVTIGTLPVGTYTVHCYNYNTGAQMCNTLQLTVSCSGCQPPTLGHLYATNITFNQYFVEFSCCPMCITC